MISPEYADRMRHLGCAVGGRDATGGLLVRVPCCSRWMTVRVAQFRHWEKKGRVLCRRCWDARRKGVKRANAGPKGGM